jgi:hypothetical protein
LVGDVGPLPGVFAANALSSGFTGLNSSQQSQVLGQAALQTVETGLDYVPLVGSALSELLDLGAATKVGQQAVYAVGTALENTYQAFLGGAGGGSSHAQREAEFFAAVQQRVTQLQSGGVLTANDVSGFNQAVAYDDIYVNGFNLSQMTFTAGTNPFLPQSVPVDPVTHFQVSANTSLPVGWTPYAAVTALDANGNPVQNYSGIAIVTSTDPTMPPEILTFSNGVATISASNCPSFSTVGNQTLTVTALNCTLANNGSASFNAVTGSATIAVVPYTPPPPVNHIGIISPATVTAGVSFNITATPLNAPGNVSPLYMIQSSLTWYPSYIEALNASTGTAYTPPPGLAPSFVAWSNSIQSNAGGSGINQYSYPLPYQGLTLDKAGVYVFRISGYNDDSGYQQYQVSATSFLTVNPGTATQVAWVTAPNHITEAGLSYTRFVGTTYSFQIPNLSLCVEDNYGNVVTTDNTDVISLVLNIGNTQVTSTMTVSQGVATFSSINASVFVSCYNRDPVNLTSGTLSVGFDGIYGTLNDLALPIYGY